MEPLKENERDAAYWQSVIEQQKEDRNKLWNGPRLWAAQRKIVASTHWQDLSKPLAEEHSGPVTYNITLSTVRDMESAILSQPIRYVAEPLSPEGSSEDGRVVGNVLNYYATICDWDAVSASCLSDFLQIGHQVAYTGFNPPQPRSKSRLGGQVSSRHEPPKAPIFRCIEPEKFHFDLHGPDGTYDTASWVAEEIILPARDVYTNENYDPKHRKEASKGRIVSSEGLRKSPVRPAAGIREVKTRDVPAGSMRLYRVWDKIFKKMYVIAEGYSQGFLYANDWPYPYLDHPPYEFERNIIFRGTPFGLGIPGLIYDQQIELDRIRTYEYDTLNNTIRLLVYDSALLDKEGRNKSVFDNPKDLDAISADFSKLPNGQVPVAFVNSPPISYDFPRIANNIIDDTRLLTGADALFQGGKLPSRTSAQEIQQRTENVGAKLGAYKKKLMQFHSRTGTKLFMHIRANLGTQLELFAKDQESNVVKVSNDVFDQPFRVRVNSFEDDSSDPVVKRQQYFQAGKMLIELSPALAAAGQPIDVKKVVSELVLKQFSIDDTEQFFIGNDPEQVNPLINKPPLTNAETNPNPQGVERSPINSNVLGSVLGGANASVRL